MPDIGLQIQAEKHFGFLISENGCKCARSTPYVVRFESPKVFIELVYDGSRSFELDLLVGEKSGDSSFSISEILRLRHAPEAQTLSLIQVTASEVLASFVSQLAQMLRAYGEDFIAGKRQSFAELESQRKREVKAYALERNLRAARAEAEGAWHRKDYGAVVKALKPLRRELTAAEVRKLEFAEKHTRSGCK